MKRGRQFIINAVILTATALLTRGISVGYTVFISNTIGAEGMGVFQLILSVYLFGVTLATSGIGLTSTRMVAEELAIGSHSGIKQSVKKCVAYSAFFGILAALAMWFSAQYIATVWLHDKTGPIPLKVLAISLPFLAICAVFTGYFTAVSRVMKSSSGQIISQIFEIVTCIYLISFITPKTFDGAVLALVLGTTLGQMISMLYLWFMYVWDKRRYHKQDTPSKGLTKKMLVISLPVAASTYIRAALNMYKQIMVPHRLEKSGVSCGTALAQYGMIRGMVFPVVMFPSAFLSAFSALLIPEIAQSRIQGNSARINNLCGRIFKLTFVFSVGVAGILFAYSVELSQAIYNSTEAAAFISVFAPLVVMMYLDEIVDAILKGLGEQLHMVGVNLLDTIFSITLFYFLLPMFSIKGYIAVIFISEIFNGTLSMQRLLKVTGMRLKLFVWLGIPSVTAAFAIACGKILVRHNFILSMALGLGLYVLLLFGLGVVSKQDFAV